MVGNPHLLFFFSWFGFLVFFPLIGAILLVLSFRALQITEPPFAECWKAYFAAAAYGLLVVMLLNISTSGLSLDHAGAAAMQAAASSLTQAVVVLLMLRKFTQKALLAQLAAVILTNVIILGTAFLGKKL